MIKRVIDLLQNSFTKDAYRVGSKDLLGLDFVF